MGKDTFYKGDKTKKPNTFVLGFSLVSLGVDKSNFLLEDLELIDDSIFVFQKNI